MTFLQTTTALTVAALLAGCGGDGNTTPDDTDTLTNTGQMTPDTDVMTDTGQMSNGDGSSTMRLVSSVDNGAVVITDNDTDLVWVNDIQYCFAGVTRPEDSSCGTLSEMEVAGLTNWRIPTSSEMSEFIIAADADENITLNYINATCAVMTTSDGWVFTENSMAPGELSLVEPGNAGVRCVSGGPVTTEPRLKTILADQGSTELLRDTETELTWVNDIQYCFAGVTDRDSTSCEMLNEMTVAGLTDWRTPVSSEMSSLISAVVADDAVTLNYINADCAVMTASDAWVFTENSESPGTISQVQPGNAGIRCVSPTMP